MVLGGVLISAIGAASSIFTEDKKPTVKSISRDFIIGSVMILLVMQLLPESSSTLIKFVVGLAPLSLFQGNGRERVASGGGGIGASDDLEVKVGVPRF